MQEASRSRAGSRLTDLSGLSRLSGRDYFCGVVDRYWVTIEGRHEGQYFILSAGNPGQCDNEGSKLIVQMLAGL